MREAASTWHPTPARKAERVPLQPRAQQPAGHAPARGQRPVPGRARVASGRGEPAALHRRAHDRGGAHGCADARRFFTGRRMSGVVGYVPRGLEPVVIEAMTRLESRSNNRNPREDRQAGRQAARGVAHGRHAVASESWRLTPTFQRRTRPNWSARTEHETVELEFVDGLPRKSFVRATPGAEGDPLAGRGLGTRRGCGRGLPLRARGRAGAGLLVVGCGRGAGLALGVSVVPSTEIRSHDHGRHLQVRRTPPASPSVRPRDR